MQIKSFEILVLCGNQNKKLTFEVKCVISDAT